jgi:hypothetical protein
LKEFSYHAAGSAAMLTSSSTDYIFMLAMARSGSTLLAHILTSNPSIIGMGETKSEVKSTRSLLRITGRVRLLNWRYGDASGENYRYILDKLVHNELLDPANVSLLKDDRFRIIFLVREPQATIRSLLRVFPHYTEERATNFYIERSKMLREYMRILSPEKECLGLTYRQLIDCTQPALRLMENHLDLTIPLEEQYRTSDVTGKFHLGDKSEKIQAGKIIRNQSAQKEQVSISADLLARTEEEFASYLVDMENCCVTLNPGECT